MNSWRQQCGILRMYIIDEIIDERDRDPEWLLTKLEWKLVSMKNKNSDV